MNKLQIFNSAEFGEIRTVTIDNEPWFVGKDARYMGTCGTGTHIILQGRIQSREYNKKVGNQVEKKTAYEVSAYWVEDKTV